MDKQKIEEIIKALLIEIDGNPEREGLLDTPRRVATSYGKLLEGYGRSLEEEMTVFNNEHGYDELVYSGDINFFSTCEHHLLPFFGKAYIAYVPGDKIIGLSKLSRAVDIYSRRLQDQERITVQVANELERLLQPKGLAVMLDGQHFCNMARGVQQTQSTMKTMAFRGCMKDDENLKSRFMSLAR